MAITNIYAMAPNMYGVSVGPDTFQVDLRSKNPQTNLEGKPAGELSDLVLEEMNQSTEFIAGRSREILCNILAHFKCQGYQGPC